jgi:predicted DNA-binding transcriptional regulator AlpA
MTAENYEKIASALLTIPQVCKYLNIARPTFYKINATGAFGLLPIKLGTCRKVLYSRIELEAYLKESTAQGKLIPRKVWQTQRRDLKP